MPPKTVASSSLCLNASAFYKVDARLTFGIRYPLKVALVVHCPRFSLSAGMPSRRVCRARASRLLAFGVRGSGQRLRRFSQTASMQIASFIIRVLGEYLFVLKTEGDSKQGLPARVGVCLFCLLQV
eukprot:4007242-Prymnesium_polylepis.1